MINRGPDDEGLYQHGALAIGMRRLAVIDLPGGRQPLLSRDGRVVVFQNGEIYNHRKLRNLLEQRGYRFKTASDTEVLAHGYDAWGINGLLDRIDGMYAIAIHDQDSNELHLARDRFGEKPLYYSVGSKAFAFGSTLLAVAALPWVSENIDPLSLERYLALHFIPGRRTIFRDVQRVLPGELLTITVPDIKLQHHRYYTPRLGVSRNVPTDELADQVEEAVRSRLIADVPVGVFLSGGLDSSTIAAIAVQNNPSIATFSMGFGNPELDESEAARSVAQHIGSDHHELHFEENSFNALLPQVAAALDEPVGDQALLPLFWLSREVRKSVTVVLSGEGADEIFAGYSYYQSFIDERDWRLRLVDLLEPCAAGAAGSHQRFIDERLRVTASGFPVISALADRRDILEQAAHNADDWERGLVCWYAKAHDPLQGATAADLATWLADDLLVKVDRMTMAHSVEARAPYLTPALVELALNLPQSQRMTHRGAKLALRKVAERFLPPTFVNRRKQGFVLPMRPWLRGWFDARGGAAAYLADRPFPGLRPRELSMLVENDLSAGLQRERFLFALILLIEWWAAFQAKRQTLVRQRSTEQRATSNRPEIVAK